jgi:hypothetical protein
MAKRCDCTVLNSINKRIHKKMKKHPPNRGVYIIFKPENLLNTHKNQGKWKFKKNIFFEKSL